MRSQINGLVRRVLRGILTSEPTRTRGDFGRHTASPEASASALALLRSGKEALDRGEFLAALDDFQRLLDAGLFLAEGHYGWGVATLRLSRTSEAADAFRRALNAHPPHPEAGLRLAEMALAEGDATAALDYYRRTLDVAPGLAEAHFGWGSVALRIGRRREAADSFRRALDAVPPHPEAGLRLAEMVLAEGNAAAAVDLYRRALEVAPGLAEAHYGRGIAALQLGRAEEARGALGRALEIRPDYPAAVAAIGFLSFFPSRGALRPVRARRGLVCVPVLPFLRGWLGGQIYLLNFARIMSTLPKSRRPRLVVIVLIDDWKDISNLREVIDGLLQCDAVVGIFDRGGELVSSKLLLDRYVRFKRRVADGGTGWIRGLFASVDWTFPVLYPSWGSATVPRPVFWIPDFQHRFWPSYFSAVEIAGRDRDFEALASRDVPIVFSSRDAQSHFDQFYRSQRCRTYVWHFHTLSEPVPDASESMQFAELGLPPRFYYTPNQFWPHKNHATLFRGLRLLIDQGHDVTFVCTGSDLTSGTDAHQRDLLALVTELDLGRNLRLLGILPRPLQLELMRRACAVIQPSLFEGWSTVIEDARAFGRPLIVSDIPVHREQADSATTFFAPQDPASLAAAVAGVDGSLLPGPDLDREIAARRAVRDQVDVSARQFMEILACEAARQ